MKYIHLHPVLGEIVYTENFWSGRKTVTIDGQTQPVKKKAIMIGEKKATVKGNFLTGASLVFEGESFGLTPKTKWYEYVLAVLPLFFILVWGNSPALCAIFPIIGGGIGGFLAAVAACLSMVCMKKAKSPAAKIFIGLGIFAASVVCGCILGIAFVILFSLLIY